jgi:RNA polymerase sigma-70 factor (ECF subfamily)
MDTNRRRVRSATSQGEQSAAGGGDIFATTHWTVVLAAGRGSSPDADRAIEELCRTYWFPLYAYVRRRGHTKEDAEDLTQAFFARFLARNYLDGLKAERGRFRAFLLASLQHFLANAWDRSQRQKRGGGAAHLPLDWQTADDLFRLAATQAAGPEQAFDREWALALLERVVSRLRDECVAAGRGPQFEGLRPFLTAGTGERSYAGVASALRLEEPAARAAVHRLRKRYRQLLRDEIAHTLTDPSQVEEELRSLFAAFGT